MSENKTTQEIIQELDYEISRLEGKHVKLNSEIQEVEDRLEKLEERKSSLLNYLNTDSDSINQDKTE